MINAIKGPLSPLVNTLSTNPDLLLAVVKRDLNARINRWKLPQEIKRTIEPEIVDTNLLLSCKFDGSSETCLSITAYNDPGKFLRGICNALEVPNPVHVLLEVGALQGLDTRGGLGRILMARLGELFSGDIGHLDLFAVRFGRLISPMIGISSSLIVSQDPSTHYLLDTLRERFAPRPNDPSQVNPLFHDPLFIEDSRGTVGSTGRPESPSFGLSNILCSHINMRPLRNALASRG